MLAAIDEDAPDADRLDALKAMFYEVNRISATDAERILSYQMFQVARRLTSSELLTLKAIYDSMKQGKFSNYSTNIGAPQWCAIVATQMGHRFREMIWRDQRRLTEEGLLSSAVTNLGNSLLDTTYPARNGRMTELVIRFCEAIRNYNETKKEL